jgi:hypothetical protein
MDWKLELVPVPVTDVERAKAFCADHVGFGAEWATFLRLGCCSQVGTEGA